MVGFTASLASEDTLITFSIQLCWDLNGEEKNLMHSLGGWAHVSGRETAGYPSCSALPREMKITIFWAYWQFSFCSLRYPKYSKLFEIFCSWPVGTYILYLFDVGLIIGAFTEEANEKQNFTELVFCTLFFQDLFLMTVELRNFLILGNDFYIVLHLKSFSVPFIFCWDERKPTIIGILDSEVSGYFIFVVYLHLCGLCALLLEDGQHHRMTWCFWNS